VNARRARVAVAMALAAVLFVAGPSPSSAAEALPDRVIETIRHADQVTLVRLGRGVDVPRGRLPEREGALAGHESLERFPLSGSDARRFRDLFADPRNLARATAFKPAGQSTIVGFVFGGPGEFAQLAWVPATGQLLVDYFNGLQVTATLTSRGKARANSALEHYLRGHRAARADFDRAFRVE
jgi:hypothetical protein